MTSTRKTVLKAFTALLLAITCVGSVGSAFAGDPAADQPGAPKTALRWENLRVP